MVRSNETQTKGQQAAEGQQRGHDHSRQIAFDDHYHGRGGYDPSASNDISFLSKPDMYYDKCAKQPRSDDMDNRCEMPSMSSQSNTPHMGMRKTFPNLGFEGFAPNSNQQQQCERLSYEKQIKVTDMGIQTALTYVSTPHKSYIHDDDYLASDYDSPTHTVLYKPHAQQNKMSNTAVQTVLSHTSSQGRSLLCMQNNDIPTNFPPKPQMSAKRYHQRSHSGECRWPAEAASHYPTKHMDDSKNLIKERSIKISETSFSSSVPTLKDTVHSSTGKLPQSSSLVDYQEGDQCIKIYETTSKTAFGYQHSITDETLKTSNLLAQIALPVTSQSYESLSTDDHAEILIKLPIRRSFV